MKTHRRPRRRCTYLSAILLTGTAIAWSALLYFEQKNLVQGPSPREPSVRATPSFVHPPPEREKPLSLNEVHFDGITVRKKLKVVLWSHGGRANGNREHRQYEEAIKYHPFTSRVQTVEEADVVLWISVRNRIEETSFDPYPNQSFGIILDYADTQEPHRLLRSVAFPTKYAAYFKRSWASRPYRFQPGRHAVERYPRTFPITYSASRYFERPFVRHSERSIPILCTLRYSSRDRERRNKVTAFLDGYVQERGIKGARLRPVSKGFHESQDKTFQEFNSRAKIIITSNPDQWEGDSRTYEALAAGALVFVDYTESFEAIPNPLRNGTHLFVYYHDYIESLAPLLDYYLAHEAEREAIALAGYNHLLRYHRAENRLDYTLSKALPHIKAHIGEPKNTIAMHPYS